MRPNLKNQMIESLKQGHKTIPQLMKEHGKSRNTICLVIQQLTDAGRIYRKKFYAGYQYILRQEINYHDPFGLSRLCRASSPDQEHDEKVLQGTSKRGFGYRLRHIYKDHEPSNLTERGHSARLSNRQQEMR